MSGGSDAGSAYGWRPGTAGGSVGPVSLQIRLLGGLLLESDGRILPRIPSRPGRSLFAYLVLNRDRQIGRDLLAGVFWPDMPDNQARRRLSQALWQIQTLFSEAGLAGSYLLPTPNAVRFNPASDYWLDVEAFETATASLKEAGAGPGGVRDPGELAGAVELYRGDLLAGFYDDWLLMDQQRLRQIYYRALSHLATLHKSRGEFEDALVYARRLTLLEPLREDAHRDVMRLFQLAGRPNEALLQYEVCYSALADELGTEPETATTQLMESIASQRRAGRQPFVPVARSPLFDLATPVPMVGRDGPRSRAVSAIEAALTGRGAVLLVEGEPGVGKTRLLESVAEDANWRGLGVLWGEGLQGDAARSYHPLSSALRGSVSGLRSEQLAAQVDPIWLSELSRLIPDFREWLPTLSPVAALEPSEEAGRMREAIARTVIGLARATPQLLILDDFQWADDDTVAAVSHLAAVIADEPIVVCLSYRAHEARDRSAVWDGLRSIDALNRSSRLILDPLSREETSELIRVSSATRGEAEMVGRIHAETGGNPLFVLETLRAMHEHNVAAAGSQSVVGEFPLPATVQELISRRLQSLGAADRAILEVFSVAGLEAEAEVMLVALDCPRPEFFEGLDLLVSRGILYERGNRYRFRHEQVRRVALRELGPGQAGRWHRAIAAALEQLHPEDSESIAHHLVQAGLGRAAKPYAVLAAERAVAMRAYATAASHYQTALEVEELEDNERLNLLFGYEHVLDVLGRRDEQAGALADMEALVEGASDRRAAVLRRTAWHFAHTDRFQEAERAAQAALASDTEAEDRAGMADDRMALGTIGLWSGDLALAVEHLREGAELATSTQQQAHARRALGSALSAVQEYEQAAVEAQTALELFGSADDARGEAEALGLLGIITMERGESDGAVDYYDRAVVLSRRIGYRHGEAVNTANRGNALWFAGRISEALSSFAEAIELFRSMGNRRGQALVQANAASIHHSVVGDDVVAGEYCRSALEYFVEVNNEDGAAQVLCNLAEIERRAGRFDEAAHHIRKGLAAVERAGNRWMEVQLLYAQSQLLLAMGKEAEAATAADRGLSICRDLGLSNFEGGLLSVVGLARLGQDDIAGAMAATSDAVRRLSPGTDQGYLVPFRRGLVLEAAGLIEDAGRAFLEAQVLLAERLVDLPSDQLASALAIPEHRAIEDAAARSRPRQVVVRLARRDVPTGRPLRQEDFVEVAWTVDDPADAEIADSAERRRHRLTRLLAETEAADGAATVVDLATALEAGVRTIRRDLQVLRRAGVAVVTRGSRDPAGPR